LGRLTSNNQQGFTTEHRDIELLKLRNFTVGKKLPDSVFTSPDGQDQVAEIIEAMVGFVSPCFPFLSPLPLSLPSFSLQSVFNQLPNEAFMPSFSPVYAWFLSLNYD